MFFAKIKPGGKIRIGADIIVEFTRKKRIGRYIELMVSRPAGVEVKIEKAPPPPPKEA